MNLALTFLGFRYHNVPHVEIYESKIVSYLKVAMWPFLRMDMSTEEPRISSVSVIPVSAKIRFNRRTPSFDLTINRPQEKIEFRQIRLPYGLNHIVPLKAGINNIKRIAQKVTGSTLYPVCKIEGWDFEKYGFDTNSKMEAAVAR